MARSRRRRSDCFFGMHSDFHAKPEDDLVIGATLREEDIREICETLKPDFLQIDCKGHPGYTSYPSDMGNAMPSFACDPLAIWRRVTKEYGIPLYMHFSGVYDIKYCTENEGERTVNADGSPTNSVRLDGSYLDEYFIPQISEIVEKYDVDGIWVDGDCWAVRNDYHESTIAKFEEVSGISLGGNIPRRKTDPYFDELTSFTRDQFRTYLRYYVDRLHEKFPELEICSNWAFSDHMPEGVCANVDFLSGDLNPVDCVNSARYAGRMLAGQGLPWDLMSWGFRFQIYKTPLVPQKHATQLMQEAAAVISLGGAYQNNVSQFADGSPDIKNVRKSRALADFVHQRRPFCFGGKPYHQAAMLVPTFDRYKEMSTPFSREGMEKYMGLTALLCDSGQSLEIVSEAKLEGHYSEYPLIIVPELYSGLADETVEKLREYTTGGGSLLLVGSKTAKFFAERDFPFCSEFYTETPETPNFANCSIGHRKEAFRETMPSYFSLDGEDLGVTFGASVISTLSGGETVVGRLHRSFRDGGVPFASVIPYGSGKLGVIGANLGSQYNEGMQYQHRTLVSAMAEKLYDPIARIESADGMVELVSLDKDGELILQLLNALGEHTNTRSVTETRIPPSENIRISVRLDKKPLAVILHPEGRTLDFEYREGRVYFTVDRLDIHSAIQFK